ncbi:PLC-like phosphodiesterase [Amylocarpus encephaloides]|uniref:Altered inheritance of mitochondria protein 6 n=1 Tax=Amylocarpus encephaloides TaxID=45428 RepID=A0A9P7YK70_9HELO|nr:PLC-like phosphodiesterase [Amylocarpus encephaloides]
MGPLTKDYHDAISDFSSASTSTESLVKPRASYDSIDNYPDRHFEDVFLARSRVLRRNRSWREFFSMGVKARRRQAGDIGDNAAKDESNLGLLATGYVRRAHRKRSCWNYCIFGGISGLSILAALLSVNITLAAFTIYWYPDIDRVFPNWGQPGTGTEGLAWYPTDFTRDIVPIPCHSHNDYWRKVPLFSAVRAGCVGVEADVWLFNDDLFVGHNTASLTRNRTFTSLYIDPIVKILERQNPNTGFYNRTSHGVFDTDPEKALILLVDLKTGGAETWPWVLKQLEPLRERGWLSFVEHDKLHSRAVTVVGTGNAPFDVLTANSTYRDAFFDAPLETMWEARGKTPEGHVLNGSNPGEWSDEDEDLTEEATPISKPLNNVGQGMSGVTADSEFNELNSYYASVAFGKAVGIIWRGRLSLRQIGIIRGQVRGAHRRGLKVRYWDLPSWPLGLRNHVWDVLVKEGVDMLNIDDLRAVSRHVW